MGARLLSPGLRVGAVVLGSIAALWVQAAFAAMSTPVIYPAKGQTPAQMDQDKLACFQWGKAQSGFDPMAPAPHAAGASTGSARTDAGGSMNGSMVKGAAGGAAVAELTNGDAGKGAAVGVLGATVREQMKKQQASQQQQQAQMQARQQQAQQRATFERAFGACLEGRGYVVK